MRLSKFTLLLTCVFWPTAAGAQTADIDQIVDTMVRLCLGGGRTEAFSAGGSGGAELSLRSLDPRGNLKGEVRIDKSKVEGLVGGINNALSQVAADQADKVRSCLQPLRNRILDLYFPVPITQNTLEPSTEAPTPEVLYQTGIGKGGFNGWALTQGWKLLNGMLLNDGTRGDKEFAPSVAPYKPQSGDYAVEAEIRVIEDSDRYNDSFGVVVRANNQDGYALGVADNGTTRICYLSAWQGVGYLGGGASIMDNHRCKPVRRAFKPDTDWHTYRIEVKGNTIALFIDNAVMTDVTDNKFLAGGRVGLWSSNYQLEVRSFKVIKL